MAFDRTKTRAMTGRNLFKGDFTEDTKINVTLTMKEYNHGYKKAQNSLCSSPSRTLSPSRGEIPKP